MPKTAVLGTIGRGQCIHSFYLLTNDGKVSTASEDTFAGPENKGVARLNDEVKCDICGRVGYIDQASSTVFVNGRNRARIGDHFSGLFRGYLVEEPVDTIDVGG
mgnify:CR=1 FL=1